MRTSRQFVCQIRCALAPVMAIFCLASASIASDAMDLATHATCNTASTNSETVQQQLAKSGWRKAVSKADRRKVTEQVVLGNFYTQKSNWKADWKRQSRDFAKFDGVQEITRDNGTHVFRIDLYLAPTGTSKYLMLQENRVTSTSGKLKLLSRECHLTTPPSTVTTALKALGTPKGGYLKLPDKSLRAEGRMYRISGRYISMNVRKLPIKTEATEFTLIKLYSDH